MYKTSTPNHALDGLASSALEVLEASTTKTYTVKVSGRKLVYLSVTNFHGSKGRNIYSLYFHGKPKKAPRPPTTVHRGAASEEVMV